jgi:hypothetical protein
MISGPRDGRRGLTYHRSPDLSLTPVSIANTSQPSSPLRVSFELHSTHLPPSLDCTSFQLPLPLFRLSTRGTWRPCPTLAAAMPSLQGSSLDLAARSPDRSSHPPHRSLVQLDISPVPALSDLPGLESCRKDCTWSRWSHWEGGGPRTVLIYGAGRVVSKWWVVTEP